MIKENSIFLVFKCLGLKDKTEGNLLQQTFPFLFHFQHLSVGLGYFPQHMLNSLPFTGQECSCDQLLKLSSCLLPSTGQFLDHYPFNL